MLNTEKTEGLEEHIIYLHVLLLCARTYRHTLQVMYVIFHYIFIAV